MSIDTRREAVPEPALRDPVSGIRHLLLLSAAVLAGGAGVSWLAPPVFAGALFSAIALRCLWAVFGGPLEARLYAANHVLMAVGMGLMGLGVELPLLVGTLPFLLPGAAWLVAGLRHFPASGVVPVWRLMHRSLINLAMVAMYLLPASAPGAGHGGAHGHAAEMPEMTALVPSGGLVILAAMLGAYLMVHAVGAALAPLVNGVGAPLGIARVTLGASTGALANGAMSGAMALMLFSML